VQRSLRTRVARLSLLVGSAGLLAGCSAHDLELKMRFGWPTGITHQAERMRVLWTWSSVTALAVGVVVWGAIFWAIIAYRKKDDLLPKQMKYHLPIEVALSIIPFVFIAGLMYFTVRTEDYVTKISPNPDVTINVTAFKWNWEFGYAGHTYSDAASTAANDTEVVSTIGTSSEIPVLVLPVNKSILVHEESRDVIHSFWVPEFLFKRDVMPGLKNPNEFEFTPTQTGHFVGRCAELCGTYHSMMNFEVRVVSQDDYTKYVNTLASLGPDDPARQHEALAAINQDPYATTTYPFNTNRNTRSESKQPKN